MTISPFLLTDHQKQEVARKKQGSSNNPPDAVVGAYRLLLAVSEEEALTVHPLRTGGKPSERVKEAMNEDEQLVAAERDPI